MAKAACWKRRFGGNWTSATGTELSRCWYFRLMFSLEEKRIQSMKPDMGTAGAAAGELSREEHGQELLRTLACQQHFERGGAETSLESLCPLRGRSLLGNNSRLQDQGGTFRHHLVQLSTQHRKPLCSVQHTGIQVCKVCHRGHIATYPILFLESAAYRNWGWAETTAAVSPFGPTGIYLKSKPSSTKQSLWWCSFSDSALWPTPLQFFQLSSCDGAFRLFTSQCLIHPFSCLCAKKSTVPSHQFGPNSTKHIKITNLSLTSCFLEGNLF